MSTSYPVRSFPADLPGGVSRGHVSEPTEERVSSGDPVLDELLGGGFPCGRLSEVFGPPFSGRTSLLYGLLASTTSRGGFAAVVDGTDRFDPRHAEASGVHLPALLWVRPHDLRQALRSTEILLGTGGFSLVALDLADAPSALAERSTPAWARLSQRAAASRAALVLLSERRLSEGFAHLCLSLSPARSVWRTFFAGLEGRVKIVRTKRGVAGESVPLRFGDAVSQHSQRRGSIESTHRS